MLHRDLNFMTGLFVSLYHECCSDRDNAGR